MSTTLTQSQNDSIRHILETTLMSHAELARRFNCSRQTIGRIAKRTKFRKSPMRDLSDEKVAVKKELDSAFSAFERCNSRDNYRRLDEARYAYETVFGRLAQDPRRAQLVDA